MAEPIDRQAMRRIFEDTLTQMSQTYAPAEDLMVEARAQNAAGVSVVVARYKISPDGRWQCFELLDAVLWPELGVGEERGG